MNEFKVGQRVHVEFDGVISYVFSHGKRVTVASDLNPGRPNNVHTEYLTLTDPNGWPPRVGDIWEAEGREWFTRQNMANHDEVVVSPFTRPSDDYYSRNLDDFKALNPVLVRRRGQ